MSIKIPNKTKKSREKPTIGVFDVSCVDASNAKSNLALYRLVYRGRLGTIAVFLLCLSFFVQGADMAYANEEVSETSSIQTVDVSSSEDTSQDSVSSEQVVEEENSPEEDLDTEVISETEGESDIESSDVELEEDDFFEDEVTDDFEEAVELETELSDDEDDVFIVSEEATTTELMAVAYSDDSFSFNKAECTELASGSFYCQKPNENILDDALFSAPDIDGDLEIFLVRDGAQVQITQNQTDDAAPFYDKNSDTVVWHRLINDRYQIVSYDVESQEETILTDTPENNMEPNRQGKYTVWQRWVDGGWNIILNDGDSERQLTKTTSHNVAPYIHGSLVVWNQHDQVNDRTIEMYDLQTSTYVSIEDPEGMSVSNPRMVFVYDSIHANGDIVTKGYDMLAKKFIDLDTLPRSLPDELPESDPTEETRALIQNKPGGKSEIEEAIPGSNSTSTPSNATSSNPVVELTSASSTLDLTNPEPVLNEPVGDPAVDLFVEPYSPNTELLPEAEEVVEFVMPE